MRGKILIFKRFVSLVLIFSMVSSALAYEQSGWFIGVQGGQSKYKMLDKTNNAHSIVSTKINATGKMTNVACTSTQSSSSKWLGLVEKTTTTTTCTPSEASVILDGSSSVDLIMTTISTLYEDKNMNYGGVIGYKHFFAEEMNYEEFSNFKIPVYRFGFRIYLAADMGKAFKTYKNTSISLNFDALYNFFPQIENFDAGIFAGFSAGYTNYNMKYYSVSGPDFAVNAGLRFTFFKKHNLEFFGRAGLSKAKYSYDTNSAMTDEVKGNNQREICATTVGLGIFALNKAYLESMGYEYDAATGLYKKCAMVSTNVSDASMDFKTGNITDIYQEYEKPYQLGIRYTYTF